MTSSIRKRWHYLRPMYGARLVGIAYRRYECPRLNSTGLDDLSPSDNATGKILSNRTVMHTCLNIYEPPPVPRSPPPSSEDELDRSTDENLSADLLQLMVPVATERLLTSYQTPSSDQTDEELDDEDLAVGWGAEILQLPPSLEFDIRVHKGAEPLGITVDSVDRGVNGMLVISVAAGGALAKDGRLAPGDYLLSVNNESLRKVTNSQARAILRRAQLLSTEINVKYIPGEAAAAYRKSLLEAETVAPPPSRPPTQISPSSPYIHKQSPVLEVFIDECRTEAPLEQVSVSVSRLECELNVDKSEVTLSESVVCSRDSLDEGKRKVATSPATTQSQEEVFPESNNMTVTQHSTSQPPSSMLLAKHWGPEREVEVLREPNCSLGISIVGGKVDLYNAGPDSGSAISGIFIKNVLPQSPAGRTDELKTGDRILEVDDIDLRQASHERAVEVIRGAGNPVRFLVQSLIQWSVDGDVEGQSSQVASASSAGAAGGSVCRRQAPAPPTPIENLLRAAPPPVPQARTPTPELIQEGLGDEIKQDLQQKRRASLHQKSPTETRPQQETKLQSINVKSPTEPKATLSDQKLRKKGPSSSDEESEDEEDFRDLAGHIMTKKRQEVSAIPCCKNIVDPPLHRSHVDLMSTEKSGSAEDQSWDFWICSQQH
uniref:(California timema) hypothetical protein n=1 Tax=Timema californicum TaxID=61474 RepID=A0A7R9J2S0_TIMCA|nr:unnamed protein product [Timema californicum]